MSLGQQHRMAAILICDLKDYSKIASDELQEQALSHLYKAKDEAIAAHGCFYSDRFGDCLLICSDSSLDLACLALKIRDRIRALDWTGLGFRQRLTIRIALHLQRIRVEERTEGLIDNVVGEGVNITARLEPVVDPDSVFCTSAFYEDLFTNESDTPSDRRIRTTPLGIRRLAKDHGEMIIYRLDWERISVESLQFEDDGAFEIVDFVPARQGDDVHYLPQELRGRVLIHTIHAGNVIPSKFRDSLIAAGLRTERVGDILQRTFIEERDWGASQVAGSLASKLGVAGYHRVNIARALLDFGRFPGETPRDTEHLYRFAINYPFSRFMTHSQKKELLERYYDHISEYFEQRVRDKILVVGIHTYDQHNREGTQRPMVSLLFRSLGYHQKNRMPYGVFDPMFPNILGEFTADRKLAARISLNLETSGITVSHNHPYSLPEGSFEVRTQVHSFFRHLLNDFESNDYYQGSVKRNSRYASAFQLVKDMLLDTNLRYPHTGSLRNYLHLFRRPPSGREEEFEICEQAYEDIRSFLSMDRHGRRSNREEEWVLLQRYRYSAERINSLAIEIRKDLVWRFNDLEGADPVQEDTGCRSVEVDRIVGSLAAAIKVYFEVDKLEHARRLRDREELPNREGR